jgi:hypothetical protein
LIFACIFGLLEHQIRYLTDFITRSSRGMSSFEFLSGSVLMETGARLAVNG